MPRHAITLSTWLAGLAMLLAATPLFAKMDAEFAMSIVPAATPQIYGVQPTFYVRIYSPTNADPTPTGTFSVAFLGDDSNYHYPCFKIAIDTNSAVQSCAYAGGYRPPVHTYHYVVFYSGDSNYNGDDHTVWASADYQIIFASPTFAMSDIPSVFVGQYFTAMDLSYSNGYVPTGTVSLQPVGSGDDSCASTLAGDGTYTACVSSQKMVNAGTFTLRLSYSGDANHSPYINDNAGTLTVYPAPTTLGVTLGSGTITLGDSVNVLVSVASIINANAEIPGTIVVGDGEVSCSITLQPNYPGQNNGYCPLAPVSAGTRQITAKFTNSENPVDYAASEASATLLVTDAKPDFTIATAVNPAGAGTVICTPNPVASGGSSTCNVTANTNFAFDAFSGDCSGASCTLSNVTANKSVVANFHSTLDRPGTISVRGIADGDTTPSTADGTDFGSTAIGTPVTHAFIIDNTGAREASLPPGSQRSATAQVTPQADGDLIVSSITSSNPAFTVSGGTGTIAAGTSAPFNVRFDASAAGTQTATITIASNDGHTPTYTFAISATASATVTSGGIAAAPTLSQWMLGLLGALLCVIARGFARRASQRDAGISTSHDAAVTSRPPCNDTPTRCTPGPSAAAGTTVSTKR